MFDVSNKSLENTPELMKLLKDSGVVDAGAEGYVNMIEGMLYYIEHQKIMNEDIVSSLEIKESVEINNIEDYR